MRYGQFEHFERFLEACPAARREEEAAELRGLGPGLEPHVRGEWIPRDRAYAHGGELMSVSHFTHHPVGFVCTPSACFS
jgi:hypothetical protein